ncbi:hypothetical protein [Streptomyces acidiscabies]|nr:hypothetical protein [Streptomyces acidiscabies]
MPLGGAYLGAVSCGVGLERERERERRGEGLASRVVLVSLGAMTEAVG